MSLEIEIEERMYVSQERSYHLSQGKRIRVSPGVNGIAQVRRFSAGVLLETFVITEEQTYGEYFLDQRFSVKCIAETVLVKIGGDNREITTGSAPDASIVGYTAPGGVERTVSGRLDDTVNVYDYGAVGDGVVDDTGAIQAAIDNCATGDVVFFPAGTYKITSEITVSKTISLRGAGIKGTIISCSGCDGFYVTQGADMLAGNAISDMSIVTNSSGLYTAIEFVGTKVAAYRTPTIIIERVNISGASVAGASVQEWLYGIKLSAADNAMLTDISIKGMETSFATGFLVDSYGIHCTDTMTAKMYGVRIYRTKTGVYITGQSEGIVFSGSEIVAVNSGVVMTGLINPASNHVISDSHVAARVVGVKIDKTSTVNSLGHMFSNMFILKRDDQQNGGEDGYKAFDVAVDRSHFSNIATHANYQLKDMYAAGDRAFSFRDGATGNVVSGASCYTPGAGVEFLDTAADNVVRGMIVQNSTAFTMYPAVFSARRNFTDIVYDTGLGTLSQTADRYVFETEGGTAFRIANGAVATDTFLDVYGDTEANAKATLRANAGTAATVDISMSPKGSGTVSPAVNNTTDLGKAGTAWRSLYLGTSALVSGTKVIGARETGWGATMTGTADKTTALDVSTATTAQLAARFKALEDALRTHGLIGS